MEQFTAFVEKMNDIVWGPVMIVLLVGTGLYLTVRLGFVQIRYLKHAIHCISGRFDNPKEKGDISHFQALCAALSATIGTGNIAGVATAIALGGPGAVFWMWVTALVGMATKFTSCSLALRYRILHADGSASGGPMYFLEKGLKLKWLGIIFAFCAGFASFGAGCAVQSNSVADSLISQTFWPQAWKDCTIPESIPLIGNIMVMKLAIGAVLALMVGIVIIGGIKRIARVASRVVPSMCVVYIAAAFFILIRNVAEIPDAFVQIFRYAFTPVAAGGGFIGVVLARTIQKGVARGMFSNESGQGSAPMAHAAAKTTEMAREGFVAMLGPLIDTIIICTMTALVILTSGAWQVKSDQGELLYGPGGKGLPLNIIVDGEQKQVIGTVGEDPKPFVDAEGNYYELPTSSSLTASAFEKGMPKIGNLVVSFSLIFFAYSTMISWSYYGDRCFEYLLGPRAITPYRYVFCMFIVVGAIGGLDLIWTMADNMNALMAVPNLIALLGLAPVAVVETKGYLRRMREQQEL